MKWRTGHSWEEPAGLGLLPHNKILRVPSRLFVCLRCRKRVELYVSAPDSIKVDRLCPAAGCRGLLRRLVD